MDDDGPLSRLATAAWLTGCARNVSRAPGRTPMQIPMDTHPAPDAPRPARCPQCSAVARGDVPWCLVCYAPFAPEQPPGPVPRPGPPAGPTPATHPAPAALPERIPDVDALADRLLAELAATDARPAWGRRLPQTRAGRAAWATGLLAGGSGVLLAVMSLVGHVL